MKLYSKILIANRGEIAVRIIRACKEMGIATVAVYSAADAAALHAALADERYCIGGALAADSYLNGERIISAALVSGAQAIHPGCGFLAENADFARLCAQNGIAFIGPSSEVMERMSDKSLIKRLMARAGIPVIPGTETLNNVEQAFAAAETMGYPVMLKSAFGGGGRGIRLVNAPEELEAAFASAGAESIAAFGRSELYMEKYIHPARHIEFQILADEAGNAVCLGERDCSVQRKHQKLVEESPSPAVNTRQRTEMMERAVAAAKTVGYTGVGTLEFLLDKNGNFYFMEMNLRLQVEHTVTEALTGIDLVKWQIRVSAGVPLSFSQADVKLEGTALECRINAGSTGCVQLIHVPGGPDVRFDSYLIAGTEITPYYDALLGKLIVRAAAREEALRKMRAALCELMICGVEHNVDEQIDIVSSAEFTGGDYDLGCFE